MYTLGEIKHHDSTAVDGVVLRRREVVIVIHYFLFIYFLCDRTTADTIVRRDVTVTAQVFCGLGMNDTH